MSIYNAKQEIWLGWMCCVTLPHCKCSYSERSDNPTEQVWLILSSFSVSFSPDRAGATENAVQKVAQWAKVNGRKIALVEYQDHGFSPHGAAGVAALQCCSSKTHKMPVCDSFEQKVGK